jgi:predicted ATPase
MGLTSHQYLQSVSAKSPESFGSSEYPFNIPAIKTFEESDLEFHPQVTFFVGENGSGKSTLLEALAMCMGFNVEGGSRNFRFETRRSESELYKRLRVAKGARPSDGFFLRAESFFNLATEIERLDSEPAQAPPIIESYGDCSLHEQSHGESFLALLLNRFSGDGLYLLDEPEAALSPKRQLTALVAIHELVKKRSQFIIATHSPILLAYPNSKILQFDDSGIHPVRYEDSDPYQITKRFLEDTKRQLHYLLADDLFS